MVRALMRRLGLDASMPEVFSSDLQLADLLSWDPDADEHEAAS